MVTKVHWNSMVTLNDMVISMQATHCFCKPTFAAVLFRPLAIKKKNIKLNFSAFAEDVCHLCIDG